MINQHKDSIFREEDKDLAVEQVCYIPSCGLRDQRSDPTLSIIRRPVATEIYKCHLQVISTKFPDIESRLRIRDTNDKHGKNSSTGTRDADLERLKIG